MFIWWFSGNICKQKLLATGKNQKLKTIRNIQQIMTNKSLLGFRSIGLKLRWLLNTQTDNSFWTLILALITKDIPQQPWMEYACWLKKPVYLEVLIKFCSKHQKSTKVAFEYKYFWSSQMKTAQITAQLHLLSRRNLELCCLHVLKVYGLSRVRESTKKLCLAACSTQCLYELMNFSWRADKTFHRNC